MSPLYTPRTTIRTILRYAFFLALAGAAVWYVTFQARFLVWGPELTLLNEPATTQSQRVVTIEGQAQNIVAIDINGRSIFTDATGYFVEDIVLENGYTNTTIRARDRYGRERKIVKDFVYVPNL